MDHRSLQQLAAGEALEDVGLLERVTFAVHRRTCASCRTLRADLDRVTFDLSLTAPARRPPVALQGSVMAAIRATATAGPAPGAKARAGGDAAIGAAVRRWQVLGGAAVGVAAVLAIVAAGLGITTIRLEQDLQRSVAALEDANSHLTAQAAAVTVALDPAHVTVALETEPLAAGSAAFVVYRPGSDDGYLMATDLPPTAAGQVYQLWLADAAGVHPLGTFTHDGGGPFVAPFGVPLDAATAAMITLEPTGGATGQPGPEVVFGEL